MILLGCKPGGRNTEQHDLFFGIGRTLGDVKKDILDFWKEANGKIHIDAWREVQHVDGYKVSVDRKRRFNCNKTKSYSLSTWVDISQMSLKNFITKC